MNRAGPALRPPGSLEGFPSWRLSPRRVLQRGHRKTNGPWWFSSAGSGRFDLPEPAGTCYFGLDTVTVLRETLGERLTTLGVLDYAFAAERYISSVRVPTSRLLANSRHATAAGFGLTRELSTMTPCAIPQAWARGFHATGLTGIRYQARFTTTAAANAIALFGDAGEQPWPADDTPEPFTAAALRSGFRVSSPPRSARIVPVP